MLNIFLSADGATQEEIMIVETSVKEELRVLGFANRLMRVAPTPVPSECIEGGLIRMERFLMPLLDALVAHAVRNDLDLAEPSNRFLLMTLTAKRITSDEGELFGNTPWVHSEQTWVSLLSTAWLHGEVGLRRERLIRRLAQHELGHALGLVPEGREDTEELYGTHCTRVCVMHQGVSVVEFWELAEAEDQQSVLFCDLCLENLKNSNFRYS